MSVVVAEREQGLVVTTDLADVSVLGRAADIATLVSDLLVNARLHASASAVRLTARVDGDMVALKVRDWGPGLSTNEIPHVFERSYRGARSVAAGIPGSGLGLHNARMLAQQMHGDLQLHAPEGGGCCFVATLPFARKRYDENPDALESAGTIDRSQLAEPSPPKDVRAQRTDTHDKELPTSC
jgi:signal transduction histidine kinase